MLNHERVQTQNVDSCGQACSRPFSASALLIALTLVAYLPAIRGGFIWDDDRYVTENKTVTRSDGLRRIWFELKATPQYYPLVFTTFWAEYRIWGANPLGYHVDNVLLHATAVCLLWTLLRRLGVRSAWLAAAIFAVHPVHVESVAWIAERKNVLSGVFYLGAILAYLRFERCRGLSRWRSNGYYMATLALFCFALLSKTVTCSLPVAILAIIGLRRRVTVSDIRRTTPLLILGLALGLVTIYLEKVHVRAEGQDWQLSPIERFLVAGRAFWFYLAKLLFPYPLTFIYSRWSIDASNPTQYLYPVAAIASLTALWAARKGIGRAPFIAVALFAMTLVPAMGFVDVYPMRFSFVADHFQYLASIGPIALFASGSTSLLHRTSRHFRAGAFTMLMGLPCLLGALTWNRALDYRDARFLWSDTLAKNPDAWIAHNNLGVLHEAQGRIDQAIQHYGDAIRLKPDLVEGHNNLANVLVKHGRLGESLAYYEKAIALRPEAPEPHCNLAMALSALGREDESLDHLNIAIRLKPSFVEARFSLGAAFSKMGRLEAAIEQFQIALQLRPSLADAHFNLAGLFARTNHPAEAIDHYEEWLRLNPYDFESRRAVESLRRSMNSP